jgi:hypothetical protein
MIQLIDARHRYIGPKAQPLQFRSVTRYLTVHHAAAVYGRGKACQAIFEWHNKQWPNYGRIGYHVVLQEELDGTINAYQVNPLGCVGAHVGNRNHEALGICAATNFGTSFPPAKWFQALADCLKLLRPLYPSAEIVGHKEIATAAFPTTCPGSKWYAWKGALLTDVSLLATETRVIGVAPSCSKAQFRNFLKARNAPLTELSMDRVYDFAAWNDIDPAFVAAVWHKEQHTEVALGLTEVGLATRNPFNLKAYGKPDKVRVKGADWNRYETWQTGLFYAILHLKEFYGREGLLSVEQIAPVFAPAEDGNNPHEYARKVIETLRAIRAIRV